MQTVIKKKSQCRKKRSKTVNNAQLWSLCAVPALFIFVFSYLPMVGLILAFKKYKYSKGIFGSEWVGFDNFKFLLSSNDFTRITRNTLCMNAIFIIVGTVAAVVVATMLFELKRRGTTKLYQTVMITPNFISWVVVSYMAYAILQPTNGVLNHILGAFGIENIDWYSKPNAWPVILTISAVWKSVGMDSVIYYAAMMGFDVSLFEAAELDGANKLQRTLYVLLPSLVSLITILTILKIGNIFRADFGLFYQVPRNIGALYPTTDVIDTYIFRTMRVVGDIGMSSAAGLLQSIVGFVMVVTVNTIVKKVSPENALL